MQRIKLITTVVIGLSLCAFFLVGFSFGFDVSPAEITFEIRSGKPNPKFHEISISCAEDDIWSVEYPFGFGGATDGTGPAALRVYPLGNLARAEDTSQLRITIGNVAKVVTIHIKREKIQKFTMRVFPEKRTFYPGGSGKFTILLTCPDKSACGTVTFTKPKDPVTGRVGVTPTYLDLPGVATTGMGSTTFTEPKLFSLDIEAETKNYKQSISMSSDVVDEGVLPEKPDTTISTDSINFVEGVYDKVEYIEIIPNTDEKLFVWEAAPTVPWLDIEPKQGKGKGRIKVTIFMEGLTENIETGAIELTFPGKTTVEKVVTVSMLPNPADNFFLWPSKILVSTPDIAPQTKFRIDVLEGVRWSVVESNPWIILSKESGIGKDEISCKILSDNKTNSILEGQIKIALDDYNVQKVVAVEGLVAPEGYLPNQVDIKELGNFSKGSMVVGSIDSGELLVPVQSHKSYYVWLDVESWPVVNLYLWRMWGTEPPPEKIFVRRYVPGFIGYSLFEVSLRVQSLPSECQPDGNPKAGNQAPQGFEIQD